MTKGAEYECSAVLTSHSADVKDVKFHPFDPILISASYDMTVKVYKEIDSEWDCVQTLGKVFRLTASSDLIFAVFHEIMGVQWAIRIQFGRAVGAQMVKESLLLVLITGMKIKLFFYKILQFTSLEE